MNPVGCEALQLHLNAFVDGELAGAEMLRVLQHLEACDDCTQEVEHIRSVGSLLRDAAAVEAVTPPMLGLAPGVIARIGAEEAQSWRGVIRRGVDDWHWVIVGGGSVAATFMSVVFAGALLLFGPVPVREDSLSALITNLGVPAGRLLIEATQAGAPKDSMLREVDTGGAYSSEAGNPRVMPAMLGLPTEGDLVGLLTNAIVPAGRLVELASMPEGERRYTESLLDNISRFRMGDSMFASASPLTVHRIRLVTNTSVSAKMEMPSP